MRRVGAGCVQGNGGGMGTLKDPDRTNNVEQVKVSYLPAGDVSIEVTCNPQLQSIRTLYLHAPMFSRNSLEVLQAKVFLR